MFGELLNKLTDKQFWANYFSSPFPHMGIGLYAGGTPGLAAGLKSYMDFTQQQAQQKLIDEMRQAQIENLRLEKMKYEDEKNLKEKRAKALASLFPPQPVMPDAQQMQMFTPEIEAFGPNSLADAISTVTTPHPLAEVVPYLPESSIATLLKANEPQKPMLVSPGQVVFDPNTGQPVYTAPSDTTKPLTLSPGQVLLDPATMQPLYTAPPKPEALPNELQRAAAYLGLPADPSTWTPQQRKQALDMELRLRQAGAAQISMGSPIPVPSGRSPTGYEYFQFPNRPGVAPQPSGVPAPPPASAEGSDTARLTAGYATRMEEAENKIKALGGKGHPTLATELTGKAPILGDFLSNKAMTPEQQMFRQAADDWIRAKLRKESGAVINKDEWEREFRTYFPVPGDTPQVIRQKEIARQTAMEAMKRAAGPAWQPSAKPPQQPTAKPSQPAAKSSGQQETIKFNGKTYRVLQHNKDGTKLIEDPETGRKGIWRP